VCVSLRGRCDGVVLRSEVAEYVMSHHPVQNQLQRLYNIPLSSPNVFLWFKTETEPTVGGK